MMLTFETVEYISQLWHPHPSSLISKESLSSPKYSTIDSLRHFPSRVAYTNLGRRKELIKTRNRDNSPLSFIHHFLNLVSYSLQMVTATILTDNSL